MMKTLLLTAVLLIAAHEACAIKCLQCRPDFDTAFGGNLSNPVVSNSSLCHNTTGTVNCNDLVSIYDSCGIASVGMNYPIFGKIKAFILNCSIKTSCNFQQLEGSMNCQQMKTSLLTSGISFTHCDTVCCEGDLCNNPVRDYSNKDKSSAKSPTSVSLVAVICGILSLIAVVFEHNLTTRINKFSSYW